MHMITSVIDYLCHSYIFCRSYISLKHISTIDIKEVNKYELLFIRKAPRIVIHIRRAECKW